MTKQDLITFIQDNIDDSLELKTKEEVLSVKDPSSFIEVGFIINRNVSSSETDVLVDSCFDDNLVGSFEGESITVKILSYELVAK